MHEKDHVSRSMEAIIATHHEFYLQNREDIERIIPELHAWIDQYFNTKGEDHDYTGSRVMKHWERLHHIQGIRKTVEHLAEKYGERYRELVFEEAQRHVMDDLGSVPDESFYRQIGIWKELRGF